MKTDEVDFIHFEPDSIYSVSDPLGCTVEIDEPEVLYLEEIDL